MSDTDEIEDIRQRKLEQLRESATTSTCGAGRVPRGLTPRRFTQTDQSESKNELIESLLESGLTGSARRRIRAVKMTRPERAKRVRHALASIIKSGDADTPLTEEQVKAVLKRVAEEEDTSFNIRR